MYPQYQVDWIPPEHLEDIKHIADGGFSSVYYAIWNRLYLKWNDKDQIVSDRNDTYELPVAIKYLTILQTLATSLCTR